jgi:hypothetical protein
MQWNINRIEPDCQIDHPMLLCGVCMYRYKHVRDFCPICFKFYASDDNPHSLTLSSNEVQMNEPTDVKKLTDSITKDSSYDPDKMVLAIKHLLSMHLISLFV